MAVPFLGLEELKALEELKRGADEVLARFRETNEQSRAVCATWRASCARAAPHRKLLKQMRVEKAELDLAIVDFERMEAKEQQGRKCKRAVRPRRRIGIDLGSDSAVVGYATPVTRSRTSRKYATALNVGGVAIDDAAATAFLHVVAPASV